MNGKRKRGIKIHNSAPSQNSNATILKRKEIATPEMTVPTAPAPMTFMQPVLENSAEIRHDVSVAVVAPAPVVSNSHATQVVTAPTARSLLAPKQKQFACAKTVSRKQPSEPTHDNTQNSKPTMNGKRKRGSKIHNSAPSQNSNATILKRKEIASPEMTVPTAPAPMTSMPPVLENSAEIRHDIKEKMSNTAMPAIKSTIQEEMNSSVSNHLQTSMDHIIENGDSVDHDNVSKPLDSLADQPLRMVMADSVENVFRPAVEATTGQNAQNPAAAEPNGATSQKIAALCSELSIVTEAVSKLTREVHALYEKSGKPCATIPPHQPKAENWESRANDLHDRCMKFMESFSSAPERKDVLEAHSLHEEIDGLLREASELVVFPKKESVDEALQLDKALLSFLETNSTPSIDREFAESVLNANSAVSRNRRLLLDSLVNRGIVFGGIPEFSSQTESQHELNFRVLARTTISRALEQGLSAAVSDLGDISYIFALAKVKADEIEKSLYTSLQLDSEDKISPKYREKVRMLKRALGDVSNSTLCLQVICGDIDSNKLVRMSSEQLANPQTRREREEIDARAKDKTILTRIVATSKKQEEDKKPAATEKKHKSDETESDESGTATPELDESPKILKTVARSSGPPPRPPSLAVSLHSQGFFAQISGSTRMRNASGTDKFKLLLGKIIFSVFLVPFKDSKVKFNAESLVPYTLHDSHRITVDAFIQFFAGKRESGNWDIYTVNVLPCTDADAREYKRFYKEFEGKHRIAMFKLPNTNKLFLITPGFHQDLKNLIRPECLSTTYGVLLLRNYTT